MKKLAIASASLALAAMPVVGVFAADDGSFTDSIQVTVAGGCTMGEEASGGGTTATDRTFTGSITNGTASTLTGSGAVVAPALEIVCNTGTATAFHINANPANNGSLVDSSTSESIASRLAESGDLSAFMYKKNASATWEAAPTTAGEIISDTASADNPFTFNPGYRVYVSLGQAAGTYEGSITYTLAMGAH